MSEVWEFTPGLALLASAMNDGRGGERGGMVVAGTGGNVNPTVSRLV